MLGKQVLVVQHRATNWTSNPCRLIVNLLYMEPQGILVPEGFATDLAESVSSLAGVGFPKVLVEPPLALADLVALIAREFLLELRAFWSLSGWSEIFFNAEVSCQEVLKPRIDFQFSHQVVT